MAKRVTYIVDDDRFESLNVQPNYGDYLHKFDTPEKRYAQTGFLEFALSKPDWERLGKPNKVRVTVSVIDE